MSPELSVTSNYVQDMERRMRAVEMQLGVKSEAQIQADDERSQATLLHEASRCLEKNYPATAHCLRSAILKRSHEIEPERRSLQEAFWEDVRRDLASPLGNFAGAAIVGTKVANAATAAGITTYLTALLSSYFDPRANTKEAMAYRERAAAEVRQHWANDVDADRWERWRRDLALRIALNSLKEHNFYSAH